MCKHIYIYFPLYTHRDVEGGYGKEEGKERKGAVERVRATAKQ